MSTGHGSWFSSAAKWVLLFHSAECTWCSGEIGGGKGCTVVKACAPPPGPSLCDLSDSHCSPATLPQTRWLLGILSIVDGLGSDQLSMTI